MQSPETLPFRSGFAVIIGRPNTGKSTLVNKLVEKKIAAVSDRPQTTRHVIKAVVNTDNSQIIFLDTPGFHKPHHHFGEQLNERVLSTLKEVDVIIFLVDGDSGVGTGDEFIANTLSKVKTGKIAVINKIDLIDEEKLKEQQERLSGIGGFDKVLTISADKGTNIDKLLDALQEYMPEGPKYFPDGMITDQPQNLLAAEIIREKIISRMEEEVPHSIFVHVESVEKRKSKDLIDIHAVVYTERDSQKGIVVGKDGANIKRVGREARIELETLLGSRIYLDLRVKLRKNWRKDMAFLQRVGF